MTQFLKLRPSPAPSETVPPGTVLVLGHFDGVHRGHRALFAEAGRMAAALSPADPLPVAAWSLTGLDRGGLLTTDGEKCRFFRHCGADWAIFESFPEIRGLTGERFFRDRLLSVCAPAALICGFNFTFGRGASCGPAELAALAAEAGIPVSVCPPVTEGGVPVSSTRIREAVRGGRMEEAARLSGHPYLISGPVLHGKALGRTIGIPTLNLRLPEGKIAPPRGVYASLVRIPAPDGAQDGPPILAPGISNLGSRPTVNGDGDDVTLETHLETDCGDLYGEDVTVWLGEFLRPEKRFDSLDALKAAIAADSEAARPARERLRKGYEYSYHEDDLLL